MGEMREGATSVVDQDTQQGIVDSGEVVLPLQAEPDTGLEEEVEEEMAQAGSMELAITVESMGTRKLIVGNQNLMPTSAPIIGQIHQGMKQEELLWKSTS